MKTLLITAFFICAYGLTSFAQEKTEPIEKKPEMHSSKKASKKVFPSAIERKASPETRTSKESSKKESDELPYQRRKIDDPELIERRERQKEEKANSNKKQPSKETLEK